MPAVGGAATPAATATAPRGDPYDYDMDTLSLGAADDAEAEDFSGGDSDALDRASAQKVAAVLRRKHAKQRRYWYIPHDRFQQDNGTTPDEKLHDVAMERAGGIPSGLQELTMLAMRVTHGYRQVIACNRPSERDAIVSISFHRYGFR